jgi:hypothetical protein
MQLPLSKWRAVLLLAATVFLVAACEDQPVPPAGPTATAEAGPTAPPTVVIDSPTTQPPTTEPSITAQRPATTQPGPTTAANNVTPQAGPCPASRIFPQSLTTGEVVTTKLYFSQEGCKLRIPRIDIRTSESYLRAVSFDPPLPAGELQRTDSSPTVWEGQGSFKGEATVTLGKQLISLRQEGKYTAKTSIAKAEQLGGEIQQWAVDAKASTEYGSDAWSAKRATGQPNARRNADDGNAWAPGSQNGTIEWLELTYSQTVRPAAIHIWESYNPGFVTRIEAYDAGASQWITLWQGRHEPFQPNAVQDGCCDEPCSAYHRHQHPRMG